MKTWVFLNSFHVSAQKSLYLMISHLYFGFIKQLIYILPKHGSKMYPLLWTRDIQVIPNDQIKMYPLLWTRDIQVIPNDQMYFMVN